MERILKLIQKKQSTTNRPLIVGIDGRCGSGKSSLAKYLKEKLDCEVIHMDHFFLQEHQKSEFRNHIAGGNFDNERFVFEVQRPILENRDIVYKRYDCSSKSFIENISINREKLIVVEGTYSCHPSINNIYDLKIFLTIDKEKQIKRIKERDGEFFLEKYIKEWIPKEEAYFRVYCIDVKSDMLIELEVE